MNRAIMTNIIDRIRSKKVIVLLLSNSVTENFIVNALLALGATAICTRDPDDANECASKTQSLLINMGTFDEAFLDYARLGQERSYQRKIPIVLDPVGCGFTASRMRVVENCIDNGGITLIKGNYAEISALATYECMQRGVDSGQESISLASMKKLSARVNCAVLATGATDFVCYESREKSFSYGHSLMTSVIGMGCLVGAVAAAALAVEGDIFVASCFAAVACGIAAEAAAQKASAPGSFQIAFIDALYQLPQHIEMRDDF